MTDTLEAAQLPSKESRKSKESLELPSSLESKAVFIEMLGFTEDEAEKLSNGIHSANWLTEEFLKDKRKRIDAGHNPQAKDVEKGRESNIYGVSNIEFSYTFQEYMAELMKQNLYDGNDDAANTRLGEMIEEMDKYQVDNTRYTMAIYIPEEMLSPVYDLAQVALKDLKTRADNPAEKLAQIANDPNHPDYKKAREKSVGLTFTEDYKAAIKTIEDGLAGDESVSFEDLKRTVMHYLINPDDRIKLRDTDYRSTQVDPETFARAHIDILRRSTPGFIDQKSTDHKIAIGINGGFTSNGKIMTQYESHWRATQGQRPEKINLLANKMGSHWRATVLTNPSAVKDLAGNMSAVTYDSEGSGENRLTRDEPYGSRKQLAAYAIFDGAIGLYDIPPKGSKDVDITGHSLGGKHRGLKLLEDWRAGRIGQDPRLRQLTNLHAPAFNYHGEDPNPWNHPEVAKNLLHALKNLDDEELWSSLIAGWLVGGGDKRLRQFTNVTHTKWLYKALNEPVTKATMGYFLEADLGEIPGTGEGHVESYKNNADAAYNVAIGNRVDNPDEQEYIFNDEDIVLLGQLANLYWGTTDAMVSMQISIANWPARPQKADLDEPTPPFAIGFEDKGHYAHGTKDAQELITEADVANIFLNEKQKTCLRRSLDLVSRIHLLQGQAGKEPIKSDMIIFQLMHIRDKNGKAYKQALTEAFNMDESQLMGYLRHRIGTRRTLAGEDKDGPNQKKSPTTSHSSSPYHIVSTYLLQKQGKEGRETLLADAAVAEAQYLERQGAPLEMQTQAVQMGRKDKDNLIALETMLQATEAQIDHVHYNNQLLNTQ